MGRESPLPRSLGCILLLLLATCCLDFVPSVAGAGGGDERSGAIGPARRGLAGDDQLFLANDQLYIEFFAKSPSSRMTFNGTTYVGTQFYTDVVWSQLVENDRRFAIPSNFTFTKSQVPNQYGNGTLLQRVIFNTTVNNGSVLMADVYLTNEAVNITLTSSFNASDEPLLAPLNLPAPTKVPSRFLHSTPENNSLTIQLGPSALLVKLRVMNWHYTESWHSLSISGNVESSASGIDVSWSKYPPPTNNMATVALPGGPKIIVVHLMNNATMGCDGEIRSVYVDTRYGIRHVLSPVSADIQLIFPSLREAFHCFNATNHSVPCACNETFIDFVVYMELDKWETVVRWWLISGIVVLGVSGFMILILVFLCVARSYNRGLREDRIKEREEKRARNEESSQRTGKASLASSASSGRDAGEQSGYGATSDSSATDSSADEGSSTSAKRKSRTWQRAELSAEEEADPLLRFVYKKKTF